MSRKGYEGVLKSFLLFRGHCLLSASEMISDLNGKHGFLGLLVPLHTQM